MSNKALHKAPRQHIGWRLVGLAAAFLLLSVPALSQNTKGDSPVRNQRQVRETRLKSIKRKNNTTKDISGHRLRTKNQSSASRANASYPTVTPYAGRKKVKSDRPVKASPSYASPPRERQRPWRGDISGKPLRVVARNKKLERGTLYPNKVYTGVADGIVKRKPSEKQRPWKSGIGRGVIRNQSATGTISNVYPQNGPYVRAYRKSGKEKTPSASNGAVGGFSSRLAPRPSRRSARTPRSASGNFLRNGGSPQSASGNFIKRGRRNVYWGKFSKGERAITTDLTGRPVRTRNYHSASPGVATDGFLKLRKRVAGGDRAFRGASGGFSTASKRGQRAWIGDISGQKLHSTNPTKRTETAGQFLFFRKLSATSGAQRTGRPQRGGGYSSRSRQRVGNQPLPPKAPGIGAVGIGNYKGNLGTRPGFDTQGAGYSGSVKGRRQPKGGGSISGKLWNNNKVPIGVKTPGQGSIRAGNFQGNIPRQGAGNYRDQGENFAGFTKARKPLKGGGSITSKWNNNGVPIEGRGPGQGSVRAGSFQGNMPRGSVNNYRDQGENFAGFIKARKPLKGGGSITTHWNNNGVAINGRGPGSGTIRAGRFAGNIKTRKPEKGGGSITTNWNNNGVPIEGRGPGSDAIRAGRFAGNIKTRKPEKGGGSITTHWNNNGVPIEGRGPGSDAIRAGRFAGNIKAKQPEKGGGSVSGKLWNNNEQPIEVRTPGKGALAMNYSGKMKSKGYTQNPNASKESILKQKPDRTTYQVAGLQVKVKEGNYKEKPFAVKGSLLSVAPSRNSVKASEYAGNMKLYWSYKQNPSSAEGAQKALYFGKAYARIGNYQGNIKMHKFNDKNLQPDAQFAHNNRGNVKGERTVMTDTKLMWAKVFKKSDTQPQNLKDKSERPRYDKGEKGLWAGDPSYQKKRQAER